MPQCWLLFVLIYTHRMMLIFVSRFRPVRSFNGLLSFCLSLICGLSSAATNAAESSQNPIRVCLDSQNYPPYFFGADLGREDLAGKGMMLDLIRMSADYAQQPVKFTRKPWRRCLADIKSGHADASAPLMWSKARELWAVFPKNDRNEVVPESALWSVQYRVFVRSDSELRWDGHRFSGIRYGVGAPLGHVSHKKLKAMGVLPASTFNVVEGITMVSRGFLDGFVNESLSGQVLMNQLDVNETVSFLETPFIMSELYLIFSKKYQAENPSAVEKVYQAIAVHGEPWKAELVKRYVPEEARL